MTTGRIIGIILLVAGIVVLLVSALADILGLGTSAGVFGYMQILGSVGGAAVAVVGGVLYWRAGGQS